MKGKSKNQSFFDCFSYTKFMKTTAIIPIKMNNERLPGKNTKDLGSKPLIHYVQEYLLQAKGIDEIYVYCSSADIQEFLLPGVKFLQRSPELDLPTSNFTQIFSRFMSDVDSDIYVYAHATAPFIKVETVNECIEAVQSCKYDSSFCATVIQDYLWQDNKPLNFDATNLPRSQDLKPIYRETSGVYVFTKQAFINTKRRIGDNPFIKEVSFKEAVDINTFEDFKLAEIML